MVGFRRLLAALDLARGVCYRGWRRLACLLLATLGIWDQQRNIEMHAVRVKMMERTER